MKYFNFDSLIDKYSVSYTLITESKGGYDDMGDWVAGSATRTEKRGAIIGIRESKVYRSDGVLTEKDRELFSKESLGDITKAYVLYGTEKYKVEANPANNSEFTGVWQYTLKWVSAFKGGDDDV